jgi:hypothetical protein
MAVATALPVIAPAAVSTARSSDPSPATKGRSATAAVVTARVSDAARAQRRDRHLQTRFRMFHTSPHDRHDEKDAAMHAPLPTAARIDPADLCLPSTKPIDITHLLTPWQIGKGPSA